MGKGFSQHTLSFLEYVELEGLRIPTIPSFHLWCKLNEIEPSEETKKEVEVICENALINYAFRNNAANVITMVLQKILDKYHNYTVKQEDKMIPQINISLGSFEEQDKKQIETTVRDEIEKSNFN